MDIIYVLSAVCIGLFFLLGLFLFSSKTRKSPPGNLIGFFFILLGINFLDGSLMLSGFYLNHLNLAFWEEPLLFLFGPVIYFYSLSITKNDFQFSKIHLAHLIPFIALFFVILFQYHFAEESFKKTMIQSVIYLDQPKELLIPVLIVFSHILIYFLLSKKRLKTFRESLKMHYSTLNITWLDQSLNSLFIMLAISFVNTFFQFSGNPVLFQSGLIILIIYVLVFIGKVYFKAMEHPLLFVGDIHAKSYSDFMDENERSRIYHLLQGALQHNQVFLNPELTLDDLSAKLKVSSRKISRVINESFGQNFFDLVNTYRVEYAKKIMTENTDPGLTVLEVLYASGFNSKSSFNTQFKKKTGLTPSEFRKLNS